MRRKVEIMRQRLTVADRPRRSLEERLVVRSRRVRSMLARVIWHVYSLLRPRARLRQAIGRRYVERGFAAVNRGDLPVAFVGFHPEVESSWDEQLVALGFDPVINGLESRLDAQRRWMDEWGDLRLEAEELIDLGDGRIVVLWRGQASGRGSGVPVDFDGA